MAIQLELRGVRRRFDARDGQVVDALDTTDLTVRPGEFVCIVGPSGCGKTTLLNMVAGLDHPDRGSVTVDGRPVDGPSPERVLVFQDGGLFPWLNVRENVEFGLKVAGRPAAERRAAADLLLDKVHLKAFADARVHQL